MRKIRCCFSILILLLLTGTAHADKGQVWPYPARLAEASQKAIILHNDNEEVLILRTELKADQKIGILEFIPFPSEPAIGLAKGNPFTVVQQLITQKGLEYEDRITKGGRNPFPVEIKFEARLGVHDVTVVKIDDLSGFSKWVVGFFRKKGIKVTNNFDNVYRNAEDYLGRGIHFFVFDYVMLKKETVSIEPLCYRFKSEKLYYPLKTSNIVGGDGLVDLVLILPGSLGLLSDRSDLRKIIELFKGGNWDLSSSSKVYSNELESIDPEAGAFFKTGKIYMQVLKYSGRYDFKDDLMLDIANIAPYAYKHFIYMPYYSNYFERDGYQLAESLSPEEMKDIEEAYSQKRPEWIFEPGILEVIRESGYSLP